MVGTTTGKDKEPLSELDFAYDVAFLAEMLSVLVLALKIMDTEAHPLGVSINWTKTKIHDLSVVVMRHANVSVFKGMKWRSLSHLYILAP